VESVTSEEYSYNSQENKEEEESLGNDDEDVKEED